MLYTGGVLACEQFSTPYVGPPSTLDRPPHGRLPSLSVYVGQNCIIVSGVIMSTHMYYSCVSSSQLQSFVALRIRTNTSCYWSKLITSMLSMTLSIISAIAPGQSMDR